MDCKCHNRRYVKCNECDGMLCVACTKKNIGKTSIRPECSNCKTPLDIKFCYENLGPKRTKKCIDDTREILEHSYKNLIEYRENVKNVIKCINEKSYGINDVDKLKRKLEKLEIELEIAKGLRIIPFDPIFQQINSHTKKQQIKKYTVNCPLNGCRGILNTDFFCGICNTKACKDCLETIKDEHICKPEDIESVKQIYKSCKRCPNCSANIFKTMGCSQMWCTFCKTPFDWNTGNVISTGFFHNPHYSEYISKKRGRRTNSINNHIDYRTIGRSRIDRLQDPDTLETVSDIEVFISRDFKKMATNEGGAKLWETQISGIGIEDDPRPNKPKSILSVINGIQNTVRHIHFLCQDLEERYRDLEKTLEGFRVDYVLKNISDKTYINSVKTNYVEKVENRARHDLYTYIERVLMKCLYDAVKKVKTINDLYYWTKMMVGSINIYNTKAKITAYCFDITICKIILTTTRADSLKMDYCHHIDVDLDDLPDSFGKKSYDNEDICCCCMDEFGEYDNVVICCHCDVKACEKCIQTYLSDKETGAHCMNCKGEWDERFMVEAISKEFVQKKYRNIAIKYIFERELQKIPDIMEKVTSVKKVDRLETDIGDIMKKIFDVESNKRELKIKWINKLENDLKSLTYSELVSKFNLDKCDRSVIVADKIPCPECKKPIYYASNTKYAPCIYCGFICSIKYGIIDPHKNYVNQLLRLVFADGCSNKDYTPYLLEEIILLKN